MPRFKGGVELDQIGMIQLVHHFNFTLYYLLTRQKCVKIKDSLLYYCLTEVVCEPVLLFTKNKLNCYNNEKIVNKSKAEICAHRKHITTLLKHKLKLKLEKQ